MSTLSLFSATGASCFIIPSPLSLSNFGLSTAFISPGGSEFLLIMLVLILLFGAKDAPRIFRSIHSALDKIQRTAASFRYKIMYGDLHQQTSDDDPYDVDSTSPDEADEFHCHIDDVDEVSSELEPETPEQKSKEPEPPNPDISGVAQITKPEPETTEEETRNSKPETLN